MDTPRPIICLLIAAVLLVSILTPAAAAPFDPAILKVSVDDSLWLKYHAGPEPPDGDIIQLYRVKKVEVALLSGSREFAAHLFSPRDAKPYTFSIPHGVPNLKIRLKTWTADDIVWTTIYDYKEIGSSLVVRAVPHPLAVHTPGI